MSGNYTLEHMKMGPRDSYLCLIPKPLENVPTAQEQDSDVDVTPARSWSLLQPLSGTCLYVCPHLSSEYRSPSNLNSFLDTTASSGLVHLLLLPQ